MRVRDLATHRVFTIGPDASVWHAAKLMLKHGISGLPVVDDQMKLVGIITEGDLIRRFELGLMPALTWINAQYRSKQARLDANQNG